MQYIQLCDTSLQDTQESVRLKEGTGKWTHIVFELTVCHPLSYNPNFINQLCLLVHTVLVVTKDRVGAINNLLRIFILMLQQAKCSEKFSYVLRTFATYTVVLEICMTKGTTCSTHDLYTQLPHFKQKPPLTNYIVILISTFSVISSILRHANNS